jgi:hypothetical protein
LEKMMQQMGLEMQVPKIMLYQKSLARATTLTLKTSSCSSRRLRWIA